MEASKTFMRPATDGIVVERPDAVVEQEGAVDQTLISEGTRV